MDTLDKYELIISKIQEMCTSTVAMAPYPIGATGITTYKYGRSKSKGNKEGKIPTPRKAIVEELIKQCKGNQKNNVLLGYKYKKVRNISETINTIANTCFDILEEISKDDIERSKKRKLRRLETVSKSLEKKYNRSQVDLANAKEEEQKALNILAPRNDQIRSYLNTGKEPSEKIIDRANRKYNSWKQAQSHTREMRKGASDALDKYKQNLKTQLQIKGEKI